ncbi:MAG TPA: hypothetical protein VN914_06775 [Polyangia bacterium]|nr:hypothetical protein [Polyangia bacterium]
MIAALAGAGISTRAAAQNAMTGAPTGDIGVKLSETNTLHVGVAAEAGYDSNVFYNDQATQSSAIVRVTPSFMVTNNGRDGTARSAAVYTVGANLTYREYLNESENIRRQRAFVPTAVASLVLNGEKTRLNLGDMFTRTEDAPYFENGETIKRDSNQGTVGVGLSPGGGRITLSLRYTNVLDYFESGYSYASNMTHDGMIDGSWKWLPKTALFLQVGGALVRYLNPSAAPPTPALQRDNSTQVRALTGLRGLITPKTTLGVSLGYSTAFYPAGSPSPSGVSNILAQLEAGYMPTLLSKLGLTLTHGFRNSPVIGDYYDVDSATLALNYALGRLVATAQSSAEYRRYHNYVDAMGNNVPRKDALFGAGVGLDYYVQKWFYAGASYGIGLARQSGDNSGAAVPFTKQQVFARLGLAY